MNTNYQTIRRFVGQHRRRVVLRLLSRRLLLTAGVLCVWCAGLSLAFAAFPWTVLPWLWDLSLVAGGLALLLVVFVTTAFRRFPEEDTVTRLEKQSGMYHPLLGIALQVGAASRPGESSALSEELLQRARDSLSQYPRRLEGFRVGRQLLTGALGMCALALALFTLSPRLASFWDLPLSWGSLGMTVEPGTIVVRQHEQVSLRLQQHTPAYPSCKLTMATLNGDISRVRMVRADGDGAFVHQTDSLEESLVYWFNLGGQQTAPETLTVVSPPSLYALRVELKPPAYVGQPRRTLPSGQGNFTAYAGTRADITVGALHVLDSALLIYERDTIAMTVDSLNASTTLSVSRSGRYTFSFVDALGQTSDTVPSFYVEALRDEPPHVQFLKPAMNKALTPALQESLLVEGIDDIGIRRMTLHWQTPSADSVGVRDFSPRTRRTPHVRALIDWDLTPLGLYPGDTIYYWATATDNKPYGRPGQAVTDTFWLRVPGFEEIHDQLAQRSEKAEGTLEEVHDSQKQLEKDITKMLQSATGSREMTWEQKQLLEDVQARVEEQQDSLSSAVKELQEAVEQMKEEGTLDDDLTRKMEEVQKAVEELIKEYGDSLLFDLDKERPEELDFQDMTEALQKMKEMLPDLQQRLEQAMKYLEMLRRDQELASLAKRFENLAEQQNQVCTMSDSSQQTKRQGDLLKDISRLSRQTRQRMQPGDQQLMPPNATPSLEQVDSLAGSMQQNSPMSPSQCSSDGNKMSASLLAASQEIKDQMGSAMMQRMQAEKDRMLDMVHDALALADWQNELAEDALAPTADLPSMVRSQQALQEGLRTSMHGLDSLRMVSPQMLQNVLGNYDKALAAMSEAEGALPASQQGQPMAMAAAGLHGAAQALLEASDGMMDGQSGGSGGAGMGMMGMMRKLSGKQAAINSATGEILRQMLQGSKPGGTREGGQGQSLADAREAARRAQEALAERLNEIADEYGDKAGPGGAKRLKDLEQEARRLAKMLQNPGQQLRDRQDRFLARMLQTTLSLHREEQGKKERTSRSASVIFSPSSAPEGAESFSSTDIYYRLRQRAFQGNIPPEYRMAVKAYFDSLGVIYLKPD